MYKGREVWTFSPAVIAVPSDSARIVFLLFRKKPPAFASAHEREQVKSNLAYRVKYSSPYNK
jgi:hypothetical protein